MDLLLRGGWPAVCQAVRNRPLRKPRERQAALVLLDAAKQPVSSEQTALGDQTVLLHVYDLSPDWTGANEVMRATVGGGAFHVGMEVHGSEWTYGCLGLKASPPRVGGGHVYNCSVLLGTTALSQEDFADLLHLLCQRWRGKDYDILEHNCCSFAAALCQELGVGPLPPWITKLGDSILALSQVTSDPRRFVRQLSLESSQAVRREAGAIWSQALQETLKVLTDLKETVVEYALGGHAMQDGPPTKDGRPARSYETIEPAARAPQPEARSLPPAWPAARPLTPRAPATLPEARQRPERPGYFAPSLQRGPALTPRAPMLSPRVPASPRVVVREHMLAI